MDNSSTDSLQVFQALSKRAYHYLTDTLGYSAKVAGSYQRAWRRIFTFMQDHSITHYDQSVTQQFYEHEFGQCT